MNLDPRWLKHNPDATPTAEDAAHAENVHIIDLGGSGESADTGAGRLILQVDGSTDLAKVSDFAKYTYVDIRGERGTTGVFIDLPRAEDFGEGRLLYIIDKLGNVDSESWRTRVTVRATSDQGIDGFASQPINERNGFLVLRATNPGPVAKREWQVVGVNSPVQHTSGGFANWFTNNMEVGVGYTLTWSGAHVYAPIRFELYSQYVANKFWIRYYPTAEMATADKNRAFGSAIPAGVQVMNEFIVGGDAPARSYGTGGVVSSWNTDGTARNVYYTACTLVAGTPGRLSGTATYKDMVSVQV